jgi:hypothetical protein
MKNEKVENMTLEQLKEYVYSLIQERNNNREEIRSLKYKSEGQENLIRKLKQDLATCEHYKLFVDELKSIIINLKVRT